MELVPYSLFEIIQQAKKGLRPPFTPDEIITCITHMAKGVAPTTRCLFIYIFLPFVTSQLPFGCSFDVPTRPSR